MKTEYTDTLQEILFDRIPKPLKFEDELWEAADNLRASARLKSNEQNNPAAISREVQAIRSVYRTAR